MAAKPTANYQLIGLATASVFLMLFAFTMYKLERSGATPYKTQVKNGYATMDDSYLDPPRSTNPLDDLLESRRDRVAAANSRKEARDDDNRRFEFYSVLPDFQVDVPTDNERFQRSAAAHAAKTVKAFADDTIEAAEELAGRIIKIPTNASTTNNTPSLTARGDFLQAGSFMDMSDASRRRAEVIMLGLNARVESADVNGRTYHRVKLGPFSSQIDRHRAHKRLASANIDAIVRSN